MWLDCLAQMKKSSGLTLEQISQKSGIPKGTLNKLFSGQTKDPQLSTVAAVVHCMGHTLDDLCPISPSAAPAPSPSHAAEQEPLQEVLDQLNQEGREKVLEYAQALVALGTYKKSDPLRLEQKDA